MRKFLLAACLLTFAFTGCAQKHGVTGSSGNTHKTAVAFYNCENFFNTRHNEGKDDYEFTPEGKKHYTDFIYHKKQHNIATVLQKMATDDLPGGPAIIGLAEVEDDAVLNDLISQPEIAGRHYRYEWFNGPDVRGINVALLYDPEHFRVMQSEPLHIYLNGNGREERTRDVLFVHGMLDSEEVYVFVNHWPSRREGTDESEQKRDNAAGVVKKKMESINRKKPDAAIIIMGDFNDNPIDESIARVLDAKANKNEVATPGLYDPWADIYNSGTGTESFKKSWNLFDQIIISEAFLKNAPHNWQYRQAKIFNPDFLIDHHRKVYGYPHRSFAGNQWINGYSDHFPVMLFLGR